MKGNREQCEAWNDEVQSFLIFVSAIIFSIRLPITAFIIKSRKRRFRQIYRIK